jgi:hypothetical protein
MGISLLPLSFWYDARPELQFFVCEQVYEAQRIHQRKHYNYQFFHVALKRSHSINNDAAGRVTQSNFFQLPSVYLTDFQTFFSDPST